MAVTPIALPFGLAVSDGVASSNHSQHCSKAVVKAIRRLWGNQKSITSDGIHQLINQTKHFLLKHDSYLVENKINSMIIGDK